jgi:hypothetical protein
MLARCASPTHDRHPPVGGTELARHRIPAPRGGPPMTATPQSLVTPTTQDAIPHISKMSHLMDDLEQLADSEFWTISHGSPEALGNLLARLDRLRLTIELAAGL